MPLMNLVSAGGVPKATVTGTTGSPNIDSSTRAGKTIYRFTGSGSITIGTGGTAELLLIGGGGAGGLGGNGPPGGGGAGGYVYDASGFLPSGTLTVTVGAGGAVHTRAIQRTGFSSRIGSYFAFGGGHGGMATNDTAMGGTVGGSGGGGSWNGSIKTEGAEGVPGQGFAGWTNSANGSGGGGGSSAAATSTSGGAGTVCVYELMVQRSKR
jgi:hypothetical protein